MEFYPIIEKPAAAQYWGSEARYVAMLQAARMSIFPARKDLVAPTKAWVSFTPARYQEYGDQGMVYKPGYLTIDEGESPKVERVTHNVDHLSADVWVVPQRWARYLSGAQLRFAVEFRNHPDFQFGFPGLVPCLVDRADDTAWLSQPNFYATAGHPVEPTPIALPSNWFMRWKPGAGDRRDTRTMANVQCFLIEDYTREFDAPPDGPGVKLGEYAIADEKLVETIMPLAYGTGDMASKGRAIRELVERRK